MRDFRFRAWDEELEEWFYSDKPDDIHFFEFMDGTLRGFAIRPPRTSDDPMEPPEPYCDDYDPFQSTGLKDKNGVDLDWWEGDTLKSPDGERAIIVYNTLGAGFYAKRPQDNYFLLPIYKAWKQGWSRIGNIHEEKP